MGTTEFVVAGLLPQIASDFNTSIAAASLTISAFAAGMIIGTPTITLATRHLAPRITLAGALVVFALGHGVAALTDNLSVLVSARFVTAVATGTFWAIAAAFAARIVRPDRSSAAIGLVVGGGALATVLGVPVGALIGQITGWRGPFWILAGLALVAAIAVRALVPALEVPPATGRLRDELAVFRSSRVWLVLAACGLTNAGVLTVYSFISALIIGPVGLRADSVPIVLLLFGGASVVGSLVGGRLGARWPMTTVLTAAVGSALTVLALCAVPPTPLMVVSLFTLLGLLGSAINPVLIALAVGYGRRSPTLSSAAATSAFNLGTAAGTALGAMSLATTWAEYGPLVTAAVGAVATVVPVSCLAISRWRELNRG